MKNRTTFPEIKDKDNDPSKGVTNYKTETFLKFEMFLKNLGGLQVIFFHKSKLFSSKPTNLLQSISVRIVEREEGKQRMIYRPLRSTVAFGPFATQTGSKFW